MYILLKINYNIFFNQRSSAMCLMFFYYNTCSMDLDALTLTSPIINEFILVIHRHLNPLVYNFIDSNFNKKNISTVEVRLST